MFYFLDGKGYADLEEYMVGESVTLSGRDEEIPNLGNLTCPDKVFDGWNTEKGRERY